MTVHNINLGIGWASSGVEYAQAYRSTIFKNTGIKAKFVFMDMFLQDNLSDLTRNMGFADEDIIWLYSYFGCGSRLLACRPVKDLVILVSPF